MNKFSWYEAKSVEDALKQVNSTVTEELYNPSDNAAVFKSGGVDVLDLIKEGLIQPQKIVNIRNIPGLDKISFEDDLMQVATKAGAEAWSERTIREHILKAARAQKFHITRDDVVVSKTPRGQAAPKLYITVKYSRPVEVPGYVHVFEFQSEVSALVGRL